MKRKYKVLSALLAVSVLLGGCSSEKKSSNSLPFQKTEEERERENNAMADFNEKFEATINESNELLRTFNKSLDNLYTRQSSNEQFATVLTSIIKKSNELIKTVEGYEVHPSIMEFKQELILHLNYQHQMFLDAVDMANEDRVQKDSLRQTYLKIKQEQVELVTTWKDY